MTPLAQQRRRQEKEEEVASKAAAAAAQAAAPKEVVMGLALRMDDYDEEDEDEVDVDEDDEEEDGRADEPHAAGVGVGAIAQGVLPNSPQVVDGVRARIGQVVYATTYIQAINALGAWARSCTIIFCN